MVDKINSLGGCKISQELQKEEIDYWFDFRRCKFLHNIDTFYYSVKLTNDLRKESSDPDVIRYRKYFADLLEILEKEDSFDGSKLIYFPGWDTNLYLRPFSYAGYFKYCVSMPDYFDIFLAPVVPSGSDGGPSVTCELVIQIRSYMLWIYGVRKAYDNSYTYVEKMLDFFNLEVDFTQENRADYCWHTNYLQNPEKFFAPDNFYEMRVDRFKGAVFHTAKVGIDKYEMDYIAMGKRSDKIFLRIYLKSKEVIEKNYKPWFFMIWLFNGLINRYDLYVYEKAFMKRSWHYIDLARLEFYKEHGTDLAVKARCSEILENRVEISTDQLRRFADEITPKVNLIINIEYQVMRKHSKSYELIPFKGDYESAGIHKRVYQYLDNRSLIIDYLTRDVFRLVKRSDEWKDTNKSRRPMCAFWEALRRTRLVDCVVKPDGVKLVREYNRSLNADIVRQRALKSAVTLGIYYKGKNIDDPLSDMVDALCVLNDNDLHDAMRFKKKKLRQFNEKELAQLDLIEMPEKSFGLFDLNTGAIRE